MHGVYPVEEEPKLGRSSQAWLDIPWTVRSQFRTTWKPWLNPLFVGSGLVESNHSRVSYVMHDFSTSPS